MKLYKLLIISLFSAFLVQSASGQSNAYINIITQNSGVVTVGGTSFIEVSVGNTGPIDDIPAGKVVAQINVPSAIIGITTTGHVLPSGWTIVSSSATSIVVCNSGDIIPLFIERTILIKIQGNFVGGPSTILGQLDFRNSCTTPGSLNGDDNADNSSTTTIQVIPACPLAVTASVGSITCNGGTTTLTATATGNTGAVEYKLNNGAYQSSNIFTVNAAGSPYTVTAREVTTPTCSATSSPVTINEPAPVPPPAVSVVQPTCTSATATITITSSTTGLTFSLDGGAYAAYPAGGYTGIATGAHTLTAKDANGCISGVTNITVNAQPPIPSAPVVNIVQPSCTVATGTITVTSTVTGLTFSLDGAAYAAYPAGGYVVTAGAHTLTAQNAGGCISAVTSITVNPQPPTPAAPTVNIVQPTCTTATGNITITSITTGLTFSLDGGAYAAYPSGGYTLAAGSHTLTAQNATGCISAVTAITVNAQPVTPGAPNVGTITQPTCSVLSGAVLLTGLPSGNWVINPGNIAGNTASATISGLAPGSYNYTVTNSLGCTSASSANVLINPLPAGPAAPTVSTVQPTCTISTGTITITSATTGLTFSFDGGAYAAYPAGGYIAAAGSHTLTAQNAAGCLSVPVNITLNAPPGTPAAPAVNVVQPTCTLATGTITITSLTAGLTFSFDGGAYVSYPSVGYVVTAGVHTLTAQNTSGCISSVTTITVNAQPATPATPVIGTITQPTCAVSTGSVVLSGLPSGNWIINPGSVTGNTSGTTVSNIASGTYNFTVTNASGCISSPTGNVIINSVPGSPPAPVVSVVQPTCAVATGTITITSATTGFLFSFDGGPYAPYPAGGYVTSAGLHTLTAQDVTLCISPFTNITVNAQPATPAAPSVTVVQPTCTQATGNIVVTSSTTGLTFSLDGGAYVAYPAGGFNAATGAHTLTAQTAAGCISAITNIIINVQPPTPASPVISVSQQPGCTVATGTIIITSSTAGLTFSLDGGAYAAYPSGGYTVAAGNHTITAENASGCISPVSNVTVNPQPPTPAAPVVIVLQPTCTVASGTITITSSTTGLTFSLDGGTYAAYPAGGYVVASGNHTLTAQNTGGCISPVTNVTINAQPPTPLAPTVSVVQPTCTVATGTITVTSSTSGLLFSLDGGVYTVYPAGGYVVTAGVHTLTVQNTAGCISALTNITVNAQPATPAAPTVSVVQPTCTVTTGSITITSSTTGLTFSLDGGAYVVYPAGGYVVATGNHTLSAQNAGGCISAVVTVTVNIQPLSPSVTASAGTITCFGGTTILTATASGSTSPYQYSLNGGVTYQASNTFTVGAGTYTITVKGQNNCTATSTPVTITQATAITASLTAGTIICNGGSTTLTVTASGGTAPYQYSLDGGPYQAANTFSVRAGALTVTVKDANLCTSAVISFTVTEPTAITATSSQASTIPCNGGAASFRITASGGTPPYQYSLNGGSFQSGNSFTVNAGTYTVTVRDVNLCVFVTDPIQITQPAVLTASAVAPRIRSCGGTTEVTVSGSGGRTPYTGTGRFARGPGNWNFPVTDASGCTATTSVTIEPPGCMNLIVYPNPASSTINIYHSVAARGATVQVYKINGSLVIPSIAVPTNAFQTTIDVRILAAGNYVIMFNNGNERKTKIFQKIN